MSIPISSWRSLIALSRRLYPLVHRPSSSSCDHHRVISISSRLCSSFNHTTSLHLASIKYLVNGLQFFSSQTVVDNLPTRVLVDVELAQTGEGIAECELLKWFVKEGDEVEEFQPLCEVQSDKATIQITSRYKGKVNQCIYLPGDIVKVGETLVKMAVEESQAPIPTESGSNSTQSLHPELDKSKPTGVLSTPAVRHLANQLGVSLDDVPGTGKDGRILREDVTKVAANRGTVEDTSDSEDEFPRMKGQNKSTLPLFDNKVNEEEQHGEKTISLRGFQRTMVKTMTKAAKVPHFHYVEEIRCGTLMELKGTFQSSTTDTGLRHTFLPILIKALSLAMIKYPTLNSCFNEETLELTLKGTHNIGIAIDTERGLAVPNIKNVQSLSILEITKELMRLQNATSMNTLSPEDVSNGTITLSNIGAIGGKFGSPIVNLPEVAIIAIGRVQKVPQFAEDGSVYPVPVMTVNIGADHRVLDGATVARFCNEWKRLIEKPELLLLSMR